MGYQPTFSDFHTIFFNNNIVKKYGMKIRKSWLIAHLIGRMHVAHAIIFSTPQAKFFQTRRGNVKFAILTQAKIVTLQGINQGNLGAMNKMSNLCCLFGVNLSSNDSRHVC